MWQAAALGIIALVHQIETYFLPVMGLKSWIEIDSHEGKNAKMGSSKAIFKLKKPAIKQVHFKAEDITIR